jgi:primase-polymerase (primpol)-like protein
VITNNIYLPNTTDPYPPSLTCEDHWTVMNLEWSDSKQKFTKTPIDTNTGLPANSDIMGVPFLSATAALTDNTVLSYRHPHASELHLALIDCDNCVAPDGTVSRRVQNLLRYMDAYAEYSVTHGIHTLGWIGAVPPGGHKDREWNLEFYWAARSIPITGSRVKLPDWESPHDLHTCTEKLLELHKARFEQSWQPSAPMPNPSQPCTLSCDEILVKLFRESKGQKWYDLYSGNWQSHYESPSDADLALLMKFAFYTWKDRQMMESMFSESGAAKILVRGTVAKPTKWRTPKWLNQNYRKSSLDKAIQNTTNVYTPRETPMSPQDFCRMRPRKIHE